MVPDTASHLPAGRIRCPLRHACTDTGVKATSGFEPLWSSRTSGSARRERRSRSAGAANRARSGSGKSRESVEVPGRPRGTPGGRPRGAVAAGRPARRRGTRPQPVVSESTGAAGHGRRGPTTPGRGAQGIRAAPPVGVVQSRPHVALGRGRRCSVVTIQR